MNFKTLQNKRILNGEIDLFDQTFNVNKIPKLIDIIVVNYNENMRWDKISFKFYGSEDLADALRKFNEDSNPFALEEGDEILIPNRDDLLSFIVKDKSNTSFNVLNNYNTINYKKINISREDFLERKKQYKIPTFVNKINVKKKNSNGTITIS